MAFPAVVATSTFSDVANANTHAAGLPAPGGGILANDLLFINVGMDCASSGETVSYPDASYNEFFDTHFGSSIRGSVAWRRMAGGESGNITISTSGSQGGGIRMLLVRGAHTTEDPVHAVATGSSTNPDPPSLDPAGWATPEETLWITGACNDGNVAITAAPSTPAAWSEFGNTRWADTGGAGVATCWLESTAGSVDPGVFTMSSEQWVAWTLAVRPAPAGAVAEGPFPYVGGGYFPHQG